MSEIDLENVSKAKLLEAIIALQKRCDALEDRQDKLSANMNAYQNRIIHDDRMANAGPLTWWPFS